MSHTIRYEAEEARSAQEARRLFAALRKAKRQHPRHTAVEVAFATPDTYAGPIMVRVEVPA